MKLSLPTLLLSLVGLGFATSTLAVDKADAKARYSAAKDEASAQFKVNRAKCDSLAGNPKDVCIAQAKSDQTRAKAEAEVAYKGTDKERASARKDIANANYDVAKTKCNSLTGNDKNVCIKEAKSARIAAVEDAKADQKVSGIRKDAAEDKMDAEFKVAKEKCDGLSGEAKDACLKQAKVKFSK